MELPYGYSETRYPDFKSNARVKQYLFSQVLQVCTYNIFGSSPYLQRSYKVPKKGEGVYPDRSRKESQRRARRAVMDIALCNEFEYMFTWTLSSDFIDRYDAKEIYKKVSVFLRNAGQRKGFRYVLIPEYHKKRSGELRAAIHMHGLCVLGSVCIAPALKPDGSQRVTASGRPVFNMVDWKYGFSTCCLLDDNYDRAVMYVTKYISKSEEKIFGKWYLSSRDLRKSPELRLLDDVDFYSVLDPDLQDAHLQYEVAVYGDSRMLFEEYDAEGLPLYRGLDVSEALSSGDVVFTDYDVGYDPWQDLNYLGALEDSRNWEQLNI